MTRYDTPLRPREKLAQKAVHALSTHELLQVIIGTGTRSQPVERIARTVLKVLRRHRRLPPYATLLEVKGLGAAQAARITASFELAERVRVGLERPVVMPAMFQRPLWYTAKSAGGEVLRESILESALPLKTQRVTRQLLEQLLEVHVSSVSIALMGGEQASRPDMHDLSLARNIRAGCEILGIVVSSLSVDTKGEKVLLV